MKIFVSYTVRDSFIHVQLLEVVAEALLEFGYPYIDLLHNNARDKQNFVESNLLNSDILILLSSNSISKSEWVQWEIKKARSNDIPIIIIPASESDIPFLIENLKSRLNKQKTVTATTYKA